MNDVRNDAAPTENDLLMLAYLDGIHTVPRIVRTYDLPRLLKMSQKKLDRLMKVKDFPQPLRFNENTIGWNLLSIQLWIFDREIKI